MGPTRTTARDLPEVFELADLTLDTRQHAVFRGSQRIPLPRLSYELLLALAEAAPNLLTHQDFAERVWRGRLVTPETLAQRVLLLRRALGDNASSPRYLRGLRGVGYQLVAPVRVRTDPGERRPASQRANGEPARATGDLTLVGDVDLSLPPQPSIVVLPFDSVDGDAENENFARGLTHDIMTRIARTRGFFVIARGSAFRFAPGSHHDVREVGRKLGVRYVVQGCVQRDGSEASVNAVLADAVEGKEIWAERFHRKIDRIFETQEEITDLVVGAISAEVDLAEQRRSLLETPANLDAWSAYHRGCWHMYRFTSADYEQAQRFFELSAKLDPHSPRAPAGLSFVHWQRAFLEISADRAGEVERAFDLAQLSVSLNPRDPLGRWALGRAHLLRGEVSESIAELSTSAALNPSFAVGQYTLGFALMHAGDTTRSVEMADKARRLSPYDPMSFAMIGLRGFSLALTGQYEQAAKLMAIAIRQPNAHFHMIGMAAVCDVLAGNADAARRDLGRLLKARPGYGVKDFLRAFQLQQPTHVRLVGRAFQGLARLR
jgi:TolB-like protein/DNA-binding winged helix-turn-helix (wHTH) protein/tetratricopeptide (TPR) repeat protein